MIFLSRLAFRLNELLKRWLNVKRLLPNSSVGLNVLLCDAISAISEVRYIIGGLLGAWNVSPDH